MSDIVSLKRIAEIEFRDIVRNAAFAGYKLRLSLIDSSFVDVYVSQKLPGRFGFHWERMDAAGSIYRYDNFPDKSWKNLSTYPHHFHDGFQTNAIASPFPLDTIAGFRAFMEFVRDRLLVQVQDE